MFVVCHRNGHLHDVHCTSTFFYETDLFNVDRQIARASNNIWEYSRMFISLFIAAFAVGVFYLLLGVMAWLDCHSQFTTYHAWVSTELTALEFAAQTRYSDCLHCRADPGSCQKGSCLDDIDGWLSTWICTCQPLMDNFGVVELLLFLGNVGSFLLATTLVSQICCQGGIFPVLFCCITSLKWKEMQSVWLIKDRS